MTRVLAVPDLALERWPGVARYAAGLARHDPDLSLAPEAETIGGPRYLARYLRYPRALRRHRPVPALVHVLDHSYAHCLRAFGGIPSVVTVHDLQPLRVAGHRRSLRALVRDRLLEWVLQWARRADRWITVSAFTAGEAQRYLGLPADRVRVVPHAVDEIFFAPRDEAAVAARRRHWFEAAPGVRPFVILHVGSCVPRKNVESAIRALGVLRHGGVDAHLVQIGGRFGPEHCAALAEAQAGPFVHQEESVSDETLVASYHAADAVVLPSTYEGFGVPALEAMAAGVPIVTSGAGGLAEAVGDAALVVQPQPEPLAEALARVLTDEATRHGLILRGQLRARSHTWKHLVSMNRAVYAELLPTP